MRLCRNLFERYRHQERVRERATVQNVRLLILLKFSLCVNIIPVVAVVWFFTGEDYWHTHTCSTAPERNVSHAAIITLSLFCINQKHTLAKSTRNGRKTIEHKQEKNFQRHNHNVRLCLSRTCWLSHSIYPNKDHNIRSLLLFGLWNNGNKEELINIRILSCAQHIVLL